MIQRVHVQALELGLVHARSAAAPRTQGPSFSEILDRFLHDAEALQKTSDAAHRAALEGTVKDIRQVMRAADEAGIAFELLVDLRNRLLETYSELMRMQV
jgi:flagellar hook-basal body complex protein FliE